MYFIPGSNIMEDCIQVDEELLTDAPHRSNESCCHHQKQTPEIPDQPAPNQLPLQPWHQGAPLGDDVRKSGFQYGPYCRDALDGGADAGSGKVPG